MPDIAYGYPGLTPEERGLIRQILAEVASVAERLTHEAFGRDPREGSRLSADRASSLNGRGIYGDDYINGATLRILYANLAAVDHMKAFVSATRSDRRNVSVATLTRGGLEPLAKCWYLLNATDTADLLSLDPPMRFRWVGSM